MTSELTVKLAKLRVFVAFLGEKEQQNWWQSSFLSRSGAAFLNPVFPKTSLLARMSGVSAAAQLLHDEHIGVGDVFHLFRLPENVEHEINQLFVTDKSTDELFASEATAYAGLESLACDDTTEGAGPLFLESQVIDQSLVSRMAAAYMNGLKTNQAVFPYYRGKL
jgi:hypothetical protein